MADIPNPAFDAAPFEYIYLNEQGKRMETDAPVLRFTSEDGGVTLVPVPQWLKE